jgi:hypothetical protein
VVRIRKLSELKFSIDIKVAAQANRSFGYATAEKLRHAELFDATVRRVANSPVVASCEVGDSATDILAAVDDVVEQLQPVLQPGETVLWSGRSDTAVMFTAADLYLVPFSLLFSGFSIFWIIAASGGESSGHSSSGFFLFGIPFVVFGLYYLVGRFVAKWALKRITAYAITNRRALVLAGRRRLHEAALDGGSRITRISRNGSHMTVTFNSAVPQASFFSGWSRNAQVLPNTGLDFFDFAGRFPVAFYDVADVDRLTAALARVSAAAQS